MKKKIVVTILLSLIIVLSLSLPVFSSSYRYTGTSFRYLGEIFHEKYFEFFGGDVYFEIRGNGLVEGTHEVHTAESDVTKMTNIGISISGTTAINNAAALVRMEQILINQLELQRQQTIAALDNYLRNNTPGMEPEEYANEMENINDYYDELIREVKASYAEAKKNIRILSSIQIDKPNTVLNVGIEMDPGESGFIKQSVVSNVSGDGTYLRATNRINNTGGKTAKATKVGKYMTETMTVQGYAQIWESTEIRDGNAKGGGWWFTMP